MIGLNYCTDSALAALPHCQTNEGPWAEQESNLQSPARQADVIPLDHRPLPWVAATAYLIRAHFYILLAVMGPAGFPFAQMASVNAFLGITPTPSFAKEGVGY